MLKTLKILSGLVDTRFNLFTQISEVQVITIFLLANKILIVTNSLI